MLIITGHCPVINHLTVMMSLLLTNSPKRCSYQNSANTHLLEIFLKQNLFKSKSQFFNEVTLFIQNQNETLTSTGPEVSCSLFKLTMPFYTISNVKKYNNTLTSKHLEENSTTSH